MTKHYKTLLGQLSQKIMIYDELIKLMETEWDSVTAYSLEKVQEITNKKETLILKMQVLEENRIEGRAGRRHHRTLARSAHRELAT